jgi:hypothetical protein
LGYVSYLTVVSFTRRDFVRARLPLIVGDARLADTLEKAGAGRARAVIAATDDQATNLSIALGASQLARAQGRHVRTVVRMLDAELARKVQTILRMDRVLSPSTIAAATFAAAALYPNVRYAFELDGYLLALCRRAVGAEWAGLSPAWLRAERGASCCCVRAPTRRTTAPPTRWRRSTLTSRCWSSSGEHWMRRHTHDRSAVCHLLRASPSSRPALRPLQACCYHPESS